MGDIIIFCFFGADLNLDSVTSCSVSSESPSAVPHLYARPRHLLLFVFGTIYTKPE